MTSVGVVVNLHFNKNNHVKNKPDYRISDHINVLFKGHSLIEQSWTKQLLNTGSSISNSITVFDNIIYLF